MNIGLITIGNELLSGFTTDTNASWIGQEVSKFGGEVVKHITIGDTTDAIIAALDEASRVAQVIITTGGLGPTHDDLTADTFYIYFNDQPVFDEEYWSYLESRFQRFGRGIPRINRNQALKPQKGFSVPNPVGSARGLHYEQQGKHYFCLPGVPREMKAMMNRTILPWIKSQAGEVQVVKTLRTTGIAESALAEKISVDIKAAENQVTVAFLPQIIGVDIRMISPNKAWLDALEQRILPSIKPYLFGTGNQTLEAVLGNQLKAFGLTLAVAESCTGGLLSHRLTNTPGSSEYFPGGIVTYSNAMKMNILGVKEETLNSFGAVSAETAREMAAGVRRKTGADIGIGITGIAGPGGGTKDKPVGLVYIGLAVEAGTVAKKYEFSHDRETNKLLSTQAALNLLRKWLYERK
ncbi:MAG: competence/damage-inducible protein A [FCB group bacterium]|nr:competence/damage-inducible protein A [FCB group bacterium]